MTDQVVGVDGCKVGWLAVSITSDGKLSSRISLTIQNLWETYAHAHMILMDVPIGLSENGTRICDQEARRLLGHPRGSSVFPVPCRAAVYAQTYEEACLINQAHTGRRLSKQTWGIVPKIREVDTFLQRTPQARSILREIHPEVCFYTLNGASMVHSKRTVPGFRERIGVLRCYYPSIEQFITEAYKQLGQMGWALDDLVDATAAAITGWDGAGQLVTLPQDPPPDMLGLPMEIVYRKRDSTVTIHFRA